jgi:hypothetical protein
VLLEHLAGLIDDQVCGDVGDGLKYVLHDLDWLLTRNWEFPYSYQPLVVRVLYVGHAGMPGPIEEAVNLQLDGLETHF